MFDTHIPHRMELIVKMANYDKLNADIAALSAKVDELLEKANAPVVIPDPVIIPAPDEQPQVDAADASVAAILAKLP
jgi:hypothetical protein